ncbi:MAG: DUF5687 family protein, partial [Flavobacteriaceae bacterium]|nr:DUF5687 family protein [Flavobacteriaceae bacterium]
MFKKFFVLEWKSFIRSASFKSNLVLKIFMALGAIYFIAMFLLLGFGAYYILEKLELEPFKTVNQILLYYILFDLLIRFFFQKAPVLNIRPLLTFNISKNNIVGYTLGKTVLSYFNWIHLFFLLPFTLVLIREGFSVSGAFSWFVACFALIFLNNFLNILSNNRDVLLFVLGAVLVSIAGLHYFSIFDTALYAAPFFDGFYNTPYFVFIPVFALILVAVYTFQFYKNRLYLDSGLSVKQKDAQTENYSWLDRFGLMGSFLKNDIKLLKRNKRSRTTILMSVLFIFYGLLFFTGAVEAYEGPVWRIFAGLFVTGGFL